MEKQKIVFVFGLFLLFSACKKEDSTPTVYLTPLEESFLNFPIDDTTFFGNYLESPHLVFRPESLGIERQITSSQNSNIVYESLSIDYYRAWQGPPIKMHVSVSNNRLTINVTISGLMGDEEHSFYQLDLENAQPDLETLTYKDRVLNDVYILENTITSNYFAYEKVYFNKDFGVVAFYYGNKFYYLKS